VCILSADFVIFYFVTLNLNSCRKYVAQPNPTHRPIDNPSGVQARPARVLQENFEKFLSAKRPVCDQNGAVGLSKNIHVISDGQNNNC
jgi:hypothetical protein